MQKAIILAKQAAENGEVPIGALVTYQGEIIAQSANTTYAQNDPSGHAEINVLRQAAHILGTPRLTDCDLWVTLEPCTMCAGAISHARIKRLYFGARDPKAIHLLAYMPLKFIRAFARANVLSYSPSSLLTKEANRSFLDQALLTQMVLACRA